MSSLEVNHLKEGQQRSGKTDGGLSRQMGILDTSEEPLLDASLKNLQLETNDVGDSNGANTHQEGEKPQNHHEEVKQRPSAPKIEITSKENETTTLTLGTNMQLSDAEKKIGKDEEHSNEKGGVGLTAKFIATTTANPVVPALNHSKNESEDKHVSPKSTSYKQPPLVRGGSFTSPQEKGYVSGTYVRKASSAVSLFPSDFKANISAIKSTKEVVVLPSSSSEEKRRRLTPSYRPDQGTLPIHDGEDPTVRRLSYVTDHFGLYSPSSSRRGSDDTTLTPGNAISHRSASLDSLVVNDDVRRKSSLSKSSNAQEESTPTPTKLSTVAAKTATSSSSSSF
eukprot:m.66249 g.66249  ORF g.66249 m.66249 type:complete len:338 (+) comp8185_c1_seq1:36-1049(+)